MSGQQCAWQLGAITLQEHGHSNLSILAASILSIWTTVGGKKLQDSRHFELHQNLQPYITTFSEAVPSDYSVLQLQLQSTHSLPFAFRNLCEHFPWKKNLSWFYINCYFMRHSFVFQSHVSRLKFYIVALKPWTHVFQTNIKLLSKDSLKMSLNKTVVSIVVSVPLTKTHSAH